MLKQWGSGHNTKETQPCKRWHCWLFYDIVWVECGTCASIIVWCDSLVSRFTLHRSNPKASALVQHDCWRLVGRRGARTSELFGTDGYFLLFSDAAPEENEGCSRWLEVPRLCRMTTKVAFATDRLTACAPPVYDTDSRCWRGVRCKRRPQPRDDIHSRETGTVSPSTTTSPSSVHLSPVGRLTGTSWCIVKYL